MGVVIFLILFSFFGCEVENISPVEPSENVEEQKTDDSNSETDNESETETNKDSVNTQQKSEVIGNGSGKLSLKNVKNKHYSIKPGTYSSFHVENVTNTTIDGFGKVKISKGNINISNINGLVLSGIAVENSQNVAIHIHTSANNLTIQNISLKNISNYGVRFDINNKYDGSPRSFSENIQLKNINAEQIGTLFISQGGVKEDGFYGLIKGFKLTNSIVKNSPKLNGLTSLGLAENYEMSNNIVDNVNASPKYPNGLNTHTGIFFAKGNGKIFNNKVTNYQGSVVRAWLLSITKVGVVEIHDNIAYNSTRYGAFELQAPAYIRKSKHFSPANAKVYNNTVGLLNTGEPKFFEGRLLDLYNTYGEVEVYNNLSFKLRDNLLINNMSSPKDTKITKNTNNRYFPSAENAVHDLTNFKSKFPGVGARR